MKGIILAGGKATRLRPLTLVTNKHLLPIYNKPMIFYPLESIARAGVTEVLLVTGPDHSGSFINLIRSGKEFGLKVSYAIQEEAKGLSDALFLAEDFADNDKILVILGDNIFKHSLKNAVVEFERQDRGAKVFAKRMPIEVAQQYGVVELDEKGAVRSIVEKPKEPKSDLVQTGIYMYDQQCFEFIRQLSPSARGELEITDLNTIYVQQGTMTCETMDSWWVDAGTSFDELLRANHLVAEEIKKNGHPETTEA
jgi:glucose-1-phosphate thymidylyltransferase